MLVVKRLAMALATVALALLILWTSSQSVRGFVTGLIWDRASTLNCTGGVRGDRITLSNETITATADPLIFASGGCQLRIVDSEITAPTVLRAAGNARVIIERSRLHGSEAALEVSGRAHVELIDTALEGAVERAEQGRLEGL